MSLSHRIVGVFLLAYAAGAAMVEFGIGIVGTPGREGAKREAHVVED